MDTAKSPDAAANPWAENLSASLVVALISVPLSMGIAILCGVEAGRGLITAVVGGVVVGSLTGNRRMISGPSAGPAVMVAALLTEFGPGALGVALPVMAGLTILGGVLKLGQAFRAVSPAVIHGMLAGIGVLILASQVHVLFDAKGPGGGLKNLLAIPATVADGVWPPDGSPKQLAAGVGLLALAIMAFWPSMPKRVRVVPGALAAAGAATAIAAAFGLPIETVDMPDTIRDAVRTPAAEDFELLKSPAFWVSLLALTFVCSAETLLCSSAVDGMGDGEASDSDRELIALGVGNLVCGLLGAPPTTGVISRSSANVQAGATDRQSAIMAGAWVLLLLVLFPTALEVVPRSALAAVLMYIGYRLVADRPYGELRDFGWSEVVIFAVTLATIVSVNLLSGILVGLALGLLKLLISLGGGFHKLEIHTERDAEHDITHMHLRGAASFVRLPKLTGALEALPSDEEVHLHVEELDYIDHAGLDALSKWERARITRRVPVRVEWQYLKHKYHTVNKLDATPSQHREEPDRGHRLLDFIPPELIFRSTKFATKHEAIDYLANQIMRHHHLDPAIESIAESAWDREERGSTCLGRGLMIPHGVLRGPGDLVGAMALCGQEGWDFDAPDGEPVRCILLLATPMRAAARHLSVLAAMARIFGRRPDIADRLIAASDGEEVLAILREGPAKDVNVRFEPAAG